MKNNVIIVICMILVFVHFRVLGVPESVTLKKVMENNLDEDLTVKLEISRQKALEWKADARLHEVRLNISESGKINWRFHWISNSSKSYLVLFSNKPSFRQKGTDPGAEQKAELKIKSFIGFNKVGLILQSKGVDLKTLKVGNIMDFKLNYEKWKNPKAYYYYLFLTTGPQYYIHAQTGEFKK